MSHVIWDAGIDPDWDDWLKLFNEFENEKYRIDKIIEVDPDAEYEM